MIPNDDVRGIGASGIDDSDVSLAIGGNHAAFERLYHRYHAFVYSRCYRSVGNREQAEELVQDVFVRVWYKIGQFRGGAAFKTWLYQVAGTVLMNSSHQRRKEASRMSGSELDLLSVVARSPRPDAAIDLVQSMALLPMRQRVVLLMYDVEGYTHREVADRLLVDVGTSKSQLHLARRQMRRMLLR